MEIDIGGVYYDVASRNKYQYEGWVDYKGANFELKIGISQNTFEYATWNDNTHAIGTSILAYTGGNNNMNFIYQDSPAGLYYVRFNDVYSSGTVEAIKYGSLDLFGSAFTGGRDTETPLTRDGSSYIWTASNITMVAGEFKLHHLFFYST